MSRKEKVIVLCLFLAAFFLIKAPFYSQQPVGEEGFFAQIFFASPTKPNFLLRGRINGQETYGPSGHPSLIYEAQSGLGQIISSLVNFNSLSEKSSFFLVRLAFSLFQFVVWLSLLLVLLRDPPENSHRTLFWLLGAVIISPIAISLAIQLQVDGTVGVLAFGIVAMSMLIQVRGKVPKSLSYVLIFVGSLYIGCGKADWSVILLVTMLGSLFYFLLVRRLDSNIFIFLTLGMLGLVLGNVISYYYDPKMYLADRNMLLRMLNKANILGLSMPKHETVGSKGAFSLLEWLKITGLRMPFIIVNIGLVSSILILIKKRLKENHPFVMISVVFGLCSFFAYFLTTNFKYPESRFFAPSLVALSFALVAVFPSELTDKMKNVFKKAVIVMAAYTLILIIVAKVLNVSITLQAGVFLDKYYTKSYLDKFKGQDCVVRVPVSIGFNKPDIDFIHNGSGRAFAVKLAEKYGKRLCDMKKNN
ncbi:MAG: hypothetical protein OEZ36_02535 [Spirochaetota bacterium]|nr:hypothetical protein [Spirochaetota bacterium]